MANKDKQIEKLKQQVKSWKETAEILADKETMKIINKYKPPMSSGWNNNPDDNHAQLSEPLTNGKREKEHQKGLEKVQSPSLIISLQKQARIALIMAEYYDKGYAFANEENKAKFQELLDWIDDDINNQGKYFMSLGIDKLKVKIMELKK